MKTSETDSIYSKAVRYLFYSLFFLTPLILWTKTSEVFEYNKMLFVYISTIFILTSWLLKSVQEKRFAIRRTPLDLPILIFLASQILSTVFSIDPHTSFWGYYSRFHGGLASTISYIVLYYAFVTHFYGKSKSITNVVYTILISSLLVSFYGILEHFGIDKHVWIQDVQSRVFSTLGQPNWLSAFLISVLPLSVFFAATHKDRLTAFLFASLSIIFFITILFTKSRSGIGATFIVVFLSLSILLIKTIKSKQSLVPLILICLSLLLTSVFIGTPWTPNPKEIQKTISVGGAFFPNLEKYLNQIGLSSQIKPIETDKLSEQERWQVDLESKGIRVGGSNSMDIRNVVWQGALELGRRRPFFGFGLETFGYTYYNVRPQEHNLLSEWDFLYNKAHNEYLNFLANAGFIGLASYLGLIFAILFLLTKAALRSNSALHISLLLGFISILITNYFGFSVVIIALFFFLFPAISFSDANQPSKELSFKIFQPSIFAVVIMFLTLYSTLKIVTFWSADIAYTNGKNLALYGPNYLSDAIDYLTAAVKANDKEPLYKSALAESQAQAAFYLNEQYKNQEASAQATTKQKFLSARNEFSQAALGNSQKALDMNPHHTNYYKSRAKVGLYLASIDPIYFNDVITTLLKVSELSPTDAKTVYNLGLVYMNMNKTDEALMAFRQALTLKPDYAEAQAKITSLTTPKAP